MSSGVEFDEDKFSYNKPTAQQVSSGMPQMSYGRPMPPSNVPKMAQWLMRHGIKSANAAQIVLVGVVIFNIVVTFVVIKFLM